MIIATVTVDIHCPVQGTAYRLYADNDLLTERTFDFSPYLYICEHITLAVEPGPHTIRLEPLRSNTISISNLQVLESDPSVTFSIA